MATNFHGAFSLRAAGLVGVAAALIFTGCGSTRPTGRATEKTVAKAAEKAGENAARTFAEKPAEKAAEKTAKKNVEQVTDEAAVDGWPNFRGPDHNGISKESILPWPKTGPKQLWKKSVGKGYSSIAVAEGRIYTMGNTQGTDTVWCLDAKSGREIWKFSYACSQRRSYPGPRSTPTVDSGFVYTLSHEGHLFCLRSDSGKEVWSKHLQDDLGLRPPNRGYAGSALIQGNLLVLNAGSAGLVLEKSSGRVVWKSGTDQCGYATPVPFVMKGRKCVAIFGAGALIGVDLAGGQELWRYPWRTSWGVNATDPIVSGNEFFISSAYNKGCALIRVHEGKARKLWQNKEMMNHFSACVLYQGYLYGIDGDIRRGDSQLKCIDFKTGQTKWKTRAVRGGSVLLARDKLVALTGRGELVLAKVSPAGYQELARSQILSGDCWTVPVLAGGRLYARNLRGDMVCVQTTRQPQQPSAKAHRDTGIRIGKSICIVLDHLFDNDAIASTEDPLDGNFDIPDSKVGDTFPRTNMPRGGAPFTPKNLPGVTFLFPDYADGKKNNVSCNKQEIQIQPAHYRALYILGASENGSQRSTLTLLTSAGQREVSLNMTDWCQRKQFGEIPVLSWDHRMDERGERQKIPCAMFVQIIPLEPKISLHGLRLPDNPRIHIFALSLKE